MKTANTPLRVLHLEDNDYDAELVRRRLADEGFTPEFTRVMKRESYLAALEQGQFDLILSDYSMPGFNGGSALALAQERRPQTPFIFVSGTLGENRAVEVLKMGASNYVSKNRLDRLAPSIRQALQDSETCEREQHATEALSERAELFQQIAENVTDLVAVLDLEGHRVYASPSYETLFKNEPLDVRDSFASIHPEDRERIRHLFQETIKTGVGQRADFRFLLKDGTIRYIESQGGVIRDKHGTVSNVIVVSRDVTKRRRAEQNLKESEERFRNVFQTANDAIILTDGHGNIAAWNSASARMFDYSEEEIRGKPLTSLFPERYRERQAAGLGLTPAANASRLIAVAVESHGLRKDGNEFALELSLSTWSNNNEIFYTAVLRDITARQRTRQILEQLRRQNEVLLHAAGEGICGLDREGRITFINPAGVKMLGYEVDELIGRSWLEVVRHVKVGERPPSRGESPIFSTLSHGTVQRISGEEFWKKSGGHFSAEYVSTPIREREECTGAVVVFKDVTENKRVVERLREQAALLEHATDAICVIGLNACITYWNKSAERLYGWSVSEAIGRIAHELLFKKEARRPSQAFQALIKDGEWQGELRQVTRTGQEIIVLSRWTLMHDSQGAPKSILVINTDITEKKHLETESLRAQRLESVGRLAGGIAHDLNNMLSPILLIAPLLGLKLHDPADKEMLEMVKASAQRGADMVRQILSFSQGSKGSESLVQIRPLIDEQIKVAKQTFPPSIEVRSRVATDIRAVMGNATQLFQVLMNLCVNARDAMPNGGSLLLEAENVLVDSADARLHSDARTGPHVVIRVSDTGTGIRPEVIDKMFKSFFTTKRPDKGTGLGLSTVLSIVKHTHGHVRVKSQVRKGTTFEIYLPSVATKITPGNKERIPALPKGQGQWVLVVDDEETIREITTATLEHAGYRVLSACDGTEAVARYTGYEDRISLVIADMVMPFMDGPAMIHALKRMNPSVKILGMSGRMEDKNLALLIEKEEVLFLPKPFSSEKLLTSVHQLLARAAVAV
jgi:PAS domain S-box-containing protein